MVMVVVGDVCTNDHAILAGYYVCMLVAVIYA